MPQDASEKKKEYELFQERLRSKKTQVVVTPKPLAEQAGKEPKKKRKGSGSDVVQAAAVPRAKRTKKSGGAGGQ